VDSIRNPFFNVGNHQGVGFLNFPGKLRLVSDLGNRTADITFFRFRSAVTPIDID